MKLKKDKSLTLIIEFIMNKKYANKSTKGKIKM